MDLSTQTSTPNKHDAIDVKLVGGLDIPEGDVLIRKVGGPEGINHYLGQVRRGRVYCLSIGQAVHVMASAPGEFDPVFKSDRTKIEEASKRAKAQNKTPDKTG